MNITTKNFLLFAAKHYWSAHYSTAEFNSDIKRIIYIKRLLRKYKKFGILSERLILNHLILLFNVFESTDAVVSMLFFKIDDYCHQSLKTFLVYLNRMPDTLLMDDIEYPTVGIALDMHIAQKLRDL